MASRGRGRNRPGGGARSGTEAPNEPASRLETPPLDQFLTLSATLTGFDVAELWATGMVRPYYALVPAIAGDAIFGELLTRWRDIAARGSGRLNEIDRLVRRDMLEDADLGPVARNLAALWYTGQWYQLPGAWRNVHGANARDLTHVVSPRAYEEALVWKAMHTHPPAARQPGFASWATPPKEGE